MQSLTLVEIRKQLFREKYKLPCYEHSVSQHFSVALAIVAALMTKGLPDIVKVSVSSALNEVHFFFDKTPLCVLEINPFATYVVDRYGRSDMYGRDTRDVEIEELADLIWECVMR